MSLEKEWEDKLNGKGVPEGIELVYREDGLRAIKYDNQE